MILNPYKWRRYFLPYLQHEKLNTNLTPSHEAAREKAIIISNGNTYCCHLFKCNQQYDGDWWEFLYAVIDVCVCVCVCVILDIVTGIVFQLIDKVYLYRCVCVYVIYVTVMFQRFVLCL